MPKKEQTSVPKTVLANFDLLPSGAQKTVTKLLEQIEINVTPEKKADYDALVSLIVGLNPVEYAEGDLPARHIAATVLTYFDVKRKD